MNPAPAKPLWFYFAGLLPAGVLFAVMLGTSDHDLLEAAQFSLGLGFPLPALGLFIWATWLAFRPANSMPEEHLRIWAWALRTLEAAAIPPTVGLLIWQLFHLLFNFSVAWPTQYWDNNYDHWRRIMLTATLAWVTTIFYCGHFRLRLLDRLTGQQPLATRKLRTAAICLCLLAGTAWVLWLATWESEFRLNLGNLLWLCAALSAQLAFALLLATACISIAWQRYLSGNGTAGPSVMLARALSWMLVSLLSFHSILQFYFQLQEILWSAKFMPFMPTFFANLHLFGGASMAGILVAAWWGWLPRRVSDRAERSVSEALSSLTWSCLISASAALFCCFHCMARTVF
jgi:hypothetical protein